MNNQNQKNMSPIAAGITGLILGIVGTAAVALSDKQTRTKVTKKANDVRDKMEKWSKDTLHDFQTTGDQMKKRAADRSEKLGESRTQTSTPSDDMKLRPDEQLPEIK